MFQSTNKGTTWTQTAFAQVSPSTSANPNDNYGQVGQKMAVSLKRQLRIFLRAIQWLPVVRYGRPFTRLHPAARARVLAHLQDDRIQKVRVGFWGLRTIVLAGYYGRPRAAQAIGYAASPRGWEALR